MTVGTKHREGEGSVGACLAGRDPGTSLLHHLLLAAEPVSSPVHRSLAGAARPLYPFPLRRPYLRPLSSQPPWPPGPLPQVALAARPEGYLVLCCSLRFWTRPDRRVRFPLLPLEGAVLGRSRAPLGWGRGSGRRGRGKPAPLCVLGFSRPSWVGEARRPQPSVPFAGNLGPAWGAPTRREGHSFILPTCADARC